MTRTCAWCSLSLKTTDALVEGDFYFCSTRHAESYRRTPDMHGRTPPSSARASAHDPVETPLHYRWHPSGVECIDIAAAFDYSLGNVIKYVWRCDYKGKPVEDLKKAATYLQRAIEERE